MPFSECLRLALRSMLAYKLRSFLTLLGIVISVATFMTILSLLLGFRDYVDEKISKIGTYTFEVQRFSVDDFESEARFEAASKRNRYLDLGELEFIRSGSSLLSAIGAKTGFSYAEVKNGPQKLTNVPVKGTDPNIAVIENLEIGEGRYFIDSENDTRAQVAYLGFETAKALFPNEPSPLTKSIYINNESYRVVGVQVAEGDVLGGTQDNFILIPLQTFSSQFGRAIVDTNLTFVCRAKSKELLNDAAEEVRSILRSKRRLKNEESDNFGINTPEALKKIRDNILGTVFIAVLSIPTIILFVGAVVITNTMLVCVTERTNEIGVRRAVGASRSSILNQFLIESITLTVIGGIIGLTIANILRLAVSVSGFPTSLPWWAIFAAIGVSGLVGLVAGILPASRAANLDPIESLQAE